MNDQGLRTELAAYARAAQGVRHPETDEAFRAEVCDWFRANGIDVSRVPMQPHPIRTADGQLTFRRVVVNELTQTAQIDPGNPNTPLIEAATAPVVVPPSESVARWIFLHENYCLWCGDRRG